MFRFVSVFPILLFAAAVALIFLAPPVYHLTLTSVPMPRSNQTTESPHEIHIIPADSQDQLDIEKYQGVFAEYHQAAEDQKNAYDDALKDMSKKIRSPVGTFASDNPKDKPQIVNANRQYDDAERKFREAMTTAQNLHRRPSKGEKQFEVAGGDFAASSAPKHSNTSVSTPAPLPQPPVVSDSQMDGSRFTTVPFVLSVVLLLASLFVILMKQYGPKDKHWAYGTVGTLIGYWLKS